jgi:hypothetical protein
MSIHLINDPEGIKNSKILDDIITKQDLEETKKREEIQRKIEAEKEEKKC